MINLVLGVVKQNILLHRGGNPGTRLWFLCLLEHHAFPFSIKHCLGTTVISVFQKDLTISICLLTFERSKPIEA